MLTVNAAFYKDVNGQDFNHYFSGTAMAWKISPTKRRLFLVNSLDGPDVRGTYLTRESLFKDKKIPFIDWWTSLDPIVLQPLMFNIGNGCAIWKHPLQKNLKKSFPWVINCIRFFGKVDANEKTMQRTSRIAFSELYGEPKQFPSIVQILAEEYPARISSEKFLVDRVAGLLFYHSRAIGKVEGPIVKLPTTKLVFKKLLMDFGVKDNQIQIVEDAPFIAAQEVLANKHMKYNPHWVEGYNPPNDLVLAGPGYAVVTVPKPGQASIFRTYEGRWPGNDNLMKGWATYNYWNQHKVV